MATDLWLVKGPDGALRASTETDEEAIRAYRVGDVIKAKVSKPRNGKHHRLGMMLLQAVFDNQDRYTSFDAFLNEVKVLTGHCETHISVSGQAYFVTKSISFESMDEIEFRRWKNEALTAVFQHFTPYMNESDRNRIETYINAVS